MGFGEYSGGGSVIWRIQHGKYETGKEHGKGVDIDAPNDHGMFTVVVDGEVVARKPIKTSKVYVIWSPDDENTVPGLKHVGRDTRVPPGN